MLGVGSLLFRFIWEPEIAKLDVLLPVSARRTGESSNGVFKTDSPNSWGSGTDWCSETSGSCEEGLELTPVPEVLGIFFELEAFWERLEFDALGTTLELWLRTCTDDDWSETENFSKLRIWNTHAPTTNVQLMMICWISKKYYLMFMLRMWWHLHARCSVYP